MATLKTMGWINWTDDPRHKRAERVCKELVIPLHKIQCVADHDNGKGKTCLVAVNGENAYHIDVPIDEMRKILDEHHKNPSKNFDTHPSVE